MPLIDFTTRPGAIEGLQVITTKQISDERGTVREYFRASAYGSLGSGGLSHCAQVNVTFTRRGAIRGLHGEAMTKLVGVVSGEAFGAYVDARRQSPTFGTLQVVELTVGTQVLVPEGVLNGFQSVSQDGCEYLYGFDTEWTANMAGVGANALDPALGIAWPIEVDPDDRSLLSAKDAALPTFSALDGAAS